MQIKKHVAFIDIHKDRAGGEIYLERIISRLSELHSDKIAFYYFTPRILEEHINVSKIEHVKIRDIGRNWNPFDMCRFIRLVPEINTLCKTHKIDCLILNGERSMYMAPFLVTGITKIGIKHMLIEKPGIHLKRRLMRTALRKMDKVVTISQFHVDHLTEQLGPWSASKFHKIYTGIDEKIFHVKKKRDTRELTFLEAASLIRRKGQLELIDAFSRLVRKYPSIKLILAGSGELKEQIEEKIHNEGIGAKVELTGFVQDTKRLYEQADITLLPSYSEGLPLTLLEAMSCECPVVASKLAGIPELVDDGQNGFLVRPGNVDDLEKAMEYFIVNPGLIQKMGHMARKKMKAHFTERSMISGWATLISKHLKGTI